MYSVPDLTLHSISIGAWNICGVKSKLSDPDFLEELQSHHIIILGESFSDNDELHIDGYKCENIFRKLKHKNARRNSGGVSVLTKTIIAKYVTPVKTTAEHLIWLKISKNLTGYPLDTYLCCTYIPPEHSPYYKTHPNLDIFDELSFDITKFSKLGHIIISGDLNARLGSKSETLRSSEINDHGEILPNLNTINPPPRCSMDHVSNKWGNKLIDICVSHNLCVLNGRTIGDLDGKFTFFGGGLSAIDLTIVDSHILSNTLGFKVHRFLPYFSSHCRIETVIACLPIGISNEDPSIQNLEFDKYVWNKNNSEEKLYNSLNSPEFSALKDKILNTKYSTNSCGTDALCRDVDDLSRYLHDNCCDKIKVGNTKKTHAKAKRQKWFTPDLQSLRKRVRRAANYLHRNPFNTQAREEAFSLNRQYRRLLKRTKKLHLAANLNKLIESVDKSEMWTILSEIRGKNKSGSPIPMKDLHTHFDFLLNNPPKNVVESKIKLLETKVNEFLKNKQTEGSNTLPVGGYTTDYIKKMVRTLKYGKSAFLDGALNEVLKHSIHEISPLLTKFFNHIEKSTFFPNAWKSSFLVPLHKKGSRGDPDNYRGLAVGSNIGKLYTKCLNNKIKKFAEENHLISPHQFGFREDYRTTDAIFSLQSMTSYYKNSKKPVFSCFVDFSKAFDSINRVALFYKLGTLGIKGDMLKLLYNVYSSSEYVIKANRQFSKPVSSNVGVKQGCNLSPLLFNLFINDIHTIFNDCNPLKIHDWKVSSLSFADDLVLLSETETGLRQCLSRLESYCNEWGLKVNPIKTKVLVFNKPFTKNVKKMSFSIDENPISVTNSYCYLGVEVSNTGSFVKAADILYKKALKALFSIYSSLDVRSDTKNTRLFLKLFDSLVKPILLYGCDIWGSAAINSNIVTNKFMNKFYRTLLGVPPNTSTAGIHSELGRFPISVNIQETMVKYWFRIISLPRDRLASHCYWSLLDLNPTKDPWITTIETALKSAGQMFVWNSQKTLSCLDRRCLSKYENYICQTLRDVSLQVNAEKINSESKLNFFKNSKPTNKLSNYLNNLSGRDRRSSFSKLRLGTLELELEKGRRHNILRADRHCKICNSNEVENETHFIFSCPALSKYRQPFIKEISDLSYNFKFMSLEDKISFLYFNENLPLNLLEISADLLRMLIAARQNLLNSIDYVTIHTLL